MRRNPPSLNSKRASVVKTILVLHAYVPIRTAVVQLLRDCGYRALEMASTDEAIVALKARMTAHLFFGASQILDMRVHQFWPKSMAPPH